MGRLTFHSMFDLFKSTVAMSHNFLFESPVKFFCTTYVIEWLRKFSGIIAWFITPHLPLLGLNMELKNIIFNFSFYIYYCNNQLIGHCMLCHPFSTNSNFYNLQKCENGFFHDNLLILSVFNKRVKLIISYIFLIFFFFTSDGTDLREI